MTTRNPAYTLPKRFLASCVLALCCGSVPQYAQKAGTRAGAANEDEELIYSIYVMRHGVRSPTADPAQYDRYASAHWPSWTVPPGYLTAHGFALIRLLGTYDREHLTTQGLLAGRNCADAARVFVHADSDERTRETARAMYEGMFPGCKPVIQENEEDVSDALFHVAPGSISADQAKLGATAVLFGAGNDPAALAAAYHAPLERFDTMLATCGAATPRPDRTSLLALPATIAPGNGDHVVEVRGPISTASTLSEIVLLEYTEGMPAKDVGWGCADGAKVREWINLHTAASEAVLRTPAVAAPQAANLLRAIAHSMEQASSGHAVAGAEGHAGDKLLLLVGHDTNLTNIAGSLGLHWILDGRRDDTPPGSTMIFELWRSRKSGEQHVRVSFMAQTLEQMRTATPLSAKQPPARTPLFVPGCSGEDGTCDAARFGKLLLQAASQGAR